MDAGHTSRHRSDIPALTGLRFFAAFFVCIAHITPYIMPGTSTIITQLAAEGMTCFFVLSGFVIHCNYSEAIYQNTASGLYRFFVSRFARLFPLYILCLSLDLVKNWGYSSLPIHTYEALPYYLTLTQSWFYSIMGNNALIYQFGAMPSVAWSVSTEWFFYVFYPFICFTLIKMPNLRDKIYLILGISVLVISSIAIIAFMITPINQFAISTFGQLADVNTHMQDSFYRWLIYFSPYSRISEFMIGCITAAIYLQYIHHIPTPKEEYYGLVTLIGALTGLIILHYFIFNAPKIADISWIIYLHMCFGFALPIAVIIFCCARYNNKISRFVSNRLFIIGGNISYSIYMLHLPIAEAFSRDAASITAFKVALADGSRLVIALCAIFGAAYITYQAVEAPCRRWIRRLLLIQNKLTDPILNERHSHHVI